MSTDSNLKFLDELKTALKNFGDIDDEMIPLKLKRDELRDKIQAWIVMHDIKEFETLDITEKTLWRISIVESERRDVDHEYLKTILTPEILNKVYKTNTIKSFKCIKVKSRKKKKDPFKEAVNDYISKTPPDGILNM